MAGIYEEIRGVFVDKQLTQDAGTEQIKEVCWAHDRYEVFEQFLAMSGIKGYGYEKIYFDFDENLNSGVKVYSDKGKIKKRSDEPLSDITLYLKVGKIDDKKSEIHFECNTLPFFTKGTKPVMQWLNQNVPILEKK